MQITRHWRMKPTRYRLEGVRYQDGTVDLQGRARQTYEPQNEASSVPVQVKRQNQTVPAA